MGPCREGLAKVAKWKGGDLRLAQSQVNREECRLHAVMNVLCRRLLSIVLLNPAQAIAQQSI